MQEVAREPPLLDGKVLMLVDLTAEILTGKVWISFRERDTELQVIKRSGKHMEVQVIKCALENRVIEIYTPTLLYIILIYSSLEVGNHLRYHSQKSDDTLLPQV